MLSEIVLFLLRLLRPASGEALSVRLLFWQMTTFHHLESAFTEGETSDSLTVFRRCMFACVSGRAFSQHDVSASVCRAVICYFAKGRKSI